VEEDGLGGGRVAEVLQDGDEVVQVVPVHGADVVEALEGRDGGDGDGAVY